jgi:hypothetical protein
MNSKLLTVAGAALIIMALNFSAAASTSYDVAGAFPFSSDTFTGTIDINGSSVDSANITLSGTGLTGDLDLTNVAFSFETGPVWSLGVDNSDYLLSFLFTLPNTKNSDVGNIGLATLSEFFTVEVCHGRGDNKVCQPETETRILKALGYGTVTPGSITTINNSEAPIPATFPLFATGLLAMGFLGWSRKRKSAVAA